jgi:hypothetical protein
VVALGGHAVKTRAAAAATIPIVVMLVVGCIPTAAPATPSPIASPPPSVEPTPSLESEGPVGAWNCTLPDHYAATTNRAQLTDIRIGPRGAGPSGFDRILFQWEGEGTPEVDIREGQPPFTQDPSGLPLEVAGEAWLVLVFHGGTAVTPEGERTYKGPTEFAVGFPQVVEMKQAGDFEAVSEWVVGMHDQACHRVEIQKSPTRVLIDIQHPQG